VSITTLVAIGLGIAAVAAAILYNPAGKSKGPAGPTGSNVIDLDAVEALAKREAAALISARIVANAAAKHVAEHSAAASPPPAPPKG
jgi:hypothetical protein